jgi:hypothetical protein
MQTLATLNGRALARTAAVTLDTNQITAPATCNTPGASEQIADLIQFVTQNQLGPGTSLVDKLQAVQTAIAANDTSGACGTLQAFIHEVQAQSGKHLTSDQAAQLITAANRIRAVLGCWQEVAPRMIEGGQRGTSFKGFTHLGWRSCLLVDLTGRKRLNAEVTTSAESTTEVANSDQLTQPSPSAGGTP